MCLSHDRKYLITSSQDSCYFWPTDSIPTLPANEEEEEEEAEGLGLYNNKHKKKRKRKSKNRDLETEEIKKSKKDELSDFFSDII